MQEDALEFRVLGPVEVLAQGRRVALRDKERALVVALVLEAGRVVSVDRLVDALWGDAAPETANVSLRVHVSRVRKALAEAGVDGRIVTKEPGYLLDLGTHDVVDAVQFAELVDRGDQAARAGQQEEASGLLSEALALWRGVALADVADGAFAQAEAVRLEQARLAAVEARIDAELVLARHGAVLGELEALCRDHPLRERFWAQRMVALYRSGRQADALRVYQDLRRRLGDELGLEPSPELARLEADILAQAPTLDVSAPKPPAATAVGLPSGVVTFVLTDIVGSTKLWDTRPADMAAALEWHDALIDAVVAGHDGVVLKAKGEGDATLSVFRRASDAVAAAATVQRQLAAEREPGGLSIAVRIAVHTGEAHERDGDYYGPTVNRAARIRALASAGEVLLSQATAELVHDRLPDGASLVELGPQRLAGVSRPEPVLALQLSGDSDIEHAEPAPHRIPLPASLAAAATFVGRAAELGAIEATWARVRAGERDAVLLAGEPGIGKTALVAEAARRMHEPGAVVLFGHCDEESLVPFQPFVEALAHWVTSVPASALRAALGTQAADLALLVPEVRARLAGIAEPGGAGHETERYRLFEAVPAVLASIAATAPVVVVLDDLHWADRPTLQLLVHTMRRTAEIPLLVLGTYRDTDLVRTHPMAETLVELRRASVVHRLAVRGLGRDDVLALVCGSRPPDPPDVALADALWRETEGSPLFLRESLRHLEETEAIAADPGGGWRPRRRIDDLGIPEGVKEVIGRRLTRLSDDANRTLRTASVIGREFAADLVARVNDTTADEVLDALDEAAVARVVAEVPGSIGRYAFTHALVREALYDELSITRRVRMHQHVGEAIEALYADDLDAHLGELAYHFGQAAVAGFADKAIDYARRAAEAAMAGVAYEEAARLYGMALEVADDAGVGTEMRCELLLGMGAADWRASDYKRARASFDEAIAIARARNDTERLARAALGYAGAAVRWIWVRVGEVDETAVARLEEALEVVGESDSPWRARLLACLAAELHFEPYADERIEQLSAEAVEVARRVGDASTLAYVLSARNLAVLGPDTAQERLANADESLRLAEELGDADLAGFGHGHRVIALLDLDDIAGVRAAHEAVSELATRSKNAALSTLALHGVGVRAGLEGRFDEAEKLHQQGFQLHQETRDPNGFFVYAAGMLDVRRFQGRLAELAAAYEVAQQAVPFAGGGRQTAGAWLRAEAGSPGADEALAEIGPDVWYPRVMQLWFLSALARAATIGGNEELAQAVYERLVPHAALNATAGGVACFGAVSHVLGVLAYFLRRSDEALRWFDDALTRYRRNGWLTLEAEASVQCAAALAAVGERDRASALLERGSSLATELGLAAVARDAKAVKAEFDGHGDAVASGRRSHVSHRDRWRGRISTRGRKVMARVVSGAEDRDLARRFGSPVAQRALFGAMARSFQPAMAFGFEGSISFEVRLPEDDTGTSSAWWTIDVQGRRATPRRGRSSTAVATAHLDLADLLRMAAGDPPFDALLDGRVTIEGDLLVFARASAMFGAVEPFEVLEAASAEPG